jgi:hypothetical protein
MTYFQNPKTKSLGLAVVLTLFFGPLGLFYATITGGLIMTFTPILLVIVLILGAGIGSTFLLASSAILLIVFGISYWIICVIWAVISINDHNNNVIDNERRIELLKKAKEINQSNVLSIKTDIPKETNTTSVDKADLLNQLSQLHSLKEKGALTEEIYEQERQEILLKLQKQNVTQSPIQTGVQEESTSPKEEYIPEYEELFGKDTWFKRNKTWMTALIIVIIASIGIYFLNEASVGSTSDQKEIENQIENVYFGLINGAYTAQSLTGTTPENLPFYNSDLKTLAVMGLAPLTMLSGTFSVEPKNIKILRMYDDNADVSYDLVLSNDGKEIVTPINMTLKKIGGKWKLDGQKFLPFDGEHGTKKKKKR